MKAANVETLKTVCIEKRSPTRIQKGGPTHIRKGSPTKVALISKEEPHKEDPQRSPT